MQIWELNLEDYNKTLEEVEKYFHIYKSKYLQSFDLVFFVPIALWDLSCKSETESFLEVKFYNSGIKSNKSRVNKDLGAVAECQKVVLNVQGEVFEATPPSEHFEISLVKIAKQISGKYQFKNCFGCAFSDYSPYGANNIGRLCCFVADSEKYLKVNSKHNEAEGDYSIFEAFDEIEFKQLKETDYCDEFKPRVNTLGGYRGSIY